MTENKLELQHEITKLPLNHNLLTSRYKLVLIHIVKQPRVKVKVIIPKKTFLAPFIMPFKNSLIAKLSSI